MKIQIDKTADKLISMCDDHAKKMAHWEEQAPAQLHHRPCEDCWSALECVEHLRRYMDFYIPVLQQKISSHSPKSTTYYHTSWLGRKAFSSMLPEGPSFRKMKTFASKNPVTDTLNTNLISVTKEQIETLSRIVSKSTSYDWGKIRVPTTLSKWICLPLGDILQFVIYHNERHIRQAMDAMKG